MYWDNIIAELSKYGVVETWNIEGFTMKEHDNISGVRIKIKHSRGAEISVISHRFSYGGTEHLFEIMPDVSETVVGYLSEKEVIEKIRELIKLSY